MGTKLRSTLRLRLSNNEQQCTEIRIRKAYVKTRVSTDQHPRCPVCGGNSLQILLTISFLFSTPGAIQLVQGISILGDTGQFLIKDMVLLGTSCWIAAEALGAIGRRVNHPI